MARHQSKAGVIWIPLITVWLALLTATHALGQISPGDLTTAHANLEGISNCTKCHDVGKKVSSLKCLECHKEIKTLVDRGKGYHASTEVRAKECFTCHNEHHGRNFAIIHFDTTGFNHGNAGFILAGHHASIRCSDCHKPALVKDKSTPRHPGSFLGLGTECIDCHSDYHQGTLSSKCLDCHNNQSFKPVLGFNHEKTRFPLKGKHLKVACVSCHKVTDRNNQKFQQFTGLAFSACTDCHKDVHEGKFGLDCKKCHSEESFQQATGLKTFDHDRTGYRLEGRHALLDCRNCHKKSFTTPLKHDVCTDCHQDYHKGQLSRGEVKIDCKECHTVAGFAPADYSIERHNSGPFPLEGAHAATPCIKCHQKGKEWLFKDLKSQCSDCHENIHRDFMGERYRNGQDCVSCHSTNAWNRVNFDHRKTGFNLEGRHASVTCRSCHFKEADDGSRIQRFAALKGDCLECHADEHHGQFESSGATTCTRCHDFDKWAIVNFNHDATGFKLEGSHQKVACSKCHKRVTEGSVSFVKYKLGDLKCSDCHLR